jgi:periplasmic protein CpxP/Spy
MKHWIKRTLATALGATLVMGSLAACAGHHRGNMTDADLAAKQIKMVDFAGKKLDLSEVQKQHLSTLATALRAQRTALMGEATDPLSGLQNLVAGTTLDRTKAQAMIEEKMVAVRSKSPDVVTAAADFFDSLNPAQQQQVRDLMQRRRGWRG